MSAGIRYSVDVDEAAVADAVAAFEFVGGNSADALRIAINKCAPKIKTAASKAIRAQVNLKADYVRERLIITKATKSRLSAAIKTPSRGMLMTRYSTDSTVALGVDKFSWIRPPLIPANGIKIKIKTTGSAKWAPSLKDTSDGSAGGKKNRPFYMVLKNSNTLGIAARLHTPGPKGGRFKVFNSPSLSQVFNTVRNDVLPDAGQELTAQLLDAMRYLLVKQHPPEPVL